MRMSAKALSLLAIAVVATTAKADSFKLTGEGNTYTFSLDASPTVTAIPYGFIVNGVTITEGSIITSNSTLTFYDTAYDGGLEIQPSPSTLVFDSDQLYSGANASPTFLLGTFKLTDDINGSKYKLVIAADAPSSPSSIPEPSSLALFATGALGVTGAVRRRWFSL